MDPNVALYGFISAVAEGADETADEYWEALDVWLRSGGLAPSWSDSERRLFNNYRTLAHKYTKEGA